MVGLPNRTGRCDVCRRLKVKCDLERPACSRCKRLGYRCHYLNSRPGQIFINGSIENPCVKAIDVFSAANTAAARPAKTPICRTPVELVRMNSTPATSHSMEFRLIHHFINSTSQTLSATEKEKAAWQVIVPSLGRATPYLLDAVLAVTALHLRFFNPDNKNLSQLSNKYMASALAQFSPLLRESTISEPNAEAMFWTSALIAYQAAFSRKFSDEEYTPPVEWFYPFQGVRAICVAGWQWLQNNDNILALVNPRDCVAVDSGESRTMLFTHLLQGLEIQLLSEPERIRLETKTAYEQAVALLDWVLQKPTPVRILSFSAHVSRRFVELISERDPRALVIISCLFAMAGQLDVWWLEGVAKREVRGILKSLPQEWQEKMEWPLKIINQGGEKNDIF